MIELACGWMFPSFRFDDVVISMELVFSDGSISERKRLSRDSRIG